MGEPWGISGPAFLWLYVAGVLLAMIATSFLRKSVRRADDREPGRTLEVEELAFLAGGPRRVVETAVADMLDRGALRASRSEGLQATGQPPRNPIEAAVLREVNRRRPLARVVRDLTAEPEVHSIRHGLTERRLLVPGEGSAAKLWRAALPLFFVFLVGAIRWFNGTTYDRPVGILTGLLLLTLIPIVAMLRRPAVWRTTAADEILGRARTRRGSTARPAADDPAIMMMGGAAGLVAMGGLSAFPDPDVRSALGPAGGGSGSGGAACAGSGGDGGGGGGGGCGGGGCGG